MKTIHTDTIIETVKNLCMEANYYLVEDVLDNLQQALSNENSKTGQEILSQIIENAKIAKKEKIPICQDTGLTVIFIELGQKIEITGKNLIDAINEGVRQGYEQGYLRKSIVKDPLKRNNSGDNTPSIIHTKIVPGNKLKIIVVPKGGGSENMSKLKMLTPSAGKEGIEEFVLDCIKQAGGSPCPPIIIGIGIGGNFEHSAFLAKKALLRKIGTKNKDSFYARMEADLLTKINNLGIGPMGLGGKTTALDVFIETHPCHIASLPVAVNIQCHAARHKEKIL